MIYICISQMQFNKERRSGLLNGLHSAIAYVKLVHYRFCNRRTLGMGSHSPEGHEGEG